MSANVGATRNRTDVFLKYRNQARSGSRPLGTGLPGSPSKASDKYVDLKLQLHACAYSNH